MQSPVVVLISADAEWSAVRTFYAEADVTPTSNGETFVVQIRGAGLAPPVRLFHGGWGKVAAAASTQYAVEKWQPELLINLGTCGGFAGRINVGDIILAEKTIVYDIIERMGDADEAIDAYTTEMDTAWAGNDLPEGVRRGLLLSADKDIAHHEIEGLQRKYDAVAADWESGAIAWVARRNGTHALILRGVTDLVDDAAGEAYGDIALFQERTTAVMNTLLVQLPYWLGRWQDGRVRQ